MIQSVGYTFSVTLDHTPGIANYRTVVWHFTQHNCVGADIGIIADSEGTQYFGTRADDYIVADGRVALALLFAGSPSVTPDK